MFKKLIKQVSKKVKKMKFKNVLSKANQYYLDKACELASLSDCRFKHGAIIRKAGNTIAVGINYGVNDPKYLDDEVAAEHAAVHAEVAALNACKKANLEGATIYVARVSKNDEPRMSKPCENCQKALKARGVKKVFYTIDNTMEL